MATAAVAPAYAPEDPTLPKPWTGLIDGSSGVLYYWNTETNATQYEKPAALLPQLTSMPKLAPIPAAGSQALNSNMPQHELGQQMHQQQPFQQMHNNQPQHMLNHHTQQYLPNQSTKYPSMQMNQMVRQQIPKLDEPSIIQCQGQQQQRLTGSHQAQQNGFLADRDAMRHIGDPAGETRYPGSVSHPSSGNKNADGAFCELQQSQADGNHRQQPLGGQPVANQTNHARSQPYMGQNMGYSEDQHGRGKSDYHFSGSNMMFQQQPKIANISQAANEQGTRTEASQPIGPSHTGVLNVAPKITMSRIHDLAAFSNGAPLGQSSRIFDSSTSTNTSPADLYRQQHEITITGGGVPDPFMSFEATGFPPEILREMRYLLQRRAYVVGCAVIRIQQLLCS